MMKVLEKIPSFYMGFFHICNFNIVAVLIYFFHYNEVPVISNTCYIMVPLYFLALQHKTYKLKYCCENRFSNGDYESYWLLGCDTVYYSPNLISPFSIPSYSWLNPSLTVLLAHCQHCAFPSPAAQLA
jgi:hypothetical protein